MNTINFRKDINVKKELKKLFVIFVLFIVGCILGYNGAVSLNNMISDPEFISKLYFHNLSIPESVDYTEFTFAIGTVLSGIGTGLIFYKYIAEKWFTSKAPLVILGILTYPFWGAIGVIGVIPYVICKVIQLIVVTIKNKK